MHGPEPVDSASEQSKTFQVVLNILFVWTLPNWPEASERKAFFPWLMAFGKQKEEKERTKMAWQKRIKEKD